MAAPAPAGALIYAKDLARLSAFYQQLLGMTVRHADDEYHVLDSPGTQLIVHAIPPVIAETFEITVPPVLREEAAIKLFFTVPSLASAGRRARALGGEVFEEEWEGPGFRVRNAHDPEGNILQLREPVE
jgi:predicted enzyme related to lactoylglutathione lyase